MSWRLAKSLETLRSQINAKYPNRSKVSDGAIGDAAHAASASDHNPNRNGVVCAIDITHDPAHGFDAGKFAEHIRTHRHPNLRYVIFNKRIAGWWTDWQWQPSVGHTQHVHVSVGTLGVGDGQTYNRYDNTTAWDLGNGGNNVVIQPSKSAADQVLDIGSNVTIPGTFTVAKLLSVGGIWQVKINKLCQSGFNWADNGIPVQPLKEVAGGTGRLDQVLQDGSKVTIPGKYKVLNLGQYKGRWLVRISMAGYKIWVDAAPLKEV
jgi:hypothetical protein